MDPELSVMPVGEQTAVRLSVSGDLDLIGASDFLEQAVKLLPSLAGPIELDLAAVEFLDCAGARALLQLHEAAVRAGHRVTVVAVSSAVALLLDLIGFRELLETGDRDDEA